MTTYSASDDASFDTALANAAANPGVDTIVLAAGVYSAPDTINSAVIIQGPKVGQDGSAGGRGLAESVLSGGIQVTAAGVTIDGVEITGAHDFGIGVTAGLYLTASGATIRN